MGFNTTKEKNKVLTLEGGRGYKQSAKMELYRVLNTSLLTGDSFYESMNERVQRIRELIARILKESDGEAFLSGLAVYSRDKMHLRTSPTILSAELFLFKCEGADKVAHCIWQRGDEFLEALSYIKMLGFKRPKRLLKAIANKVNSLSIYKLIKYAAKGKTFTLRDALRLSHPTPKDPKYNAIFKYITQGNKALTPEELQLLPEVQQLQNGEGLTWEQDISGKGSTKENWENTIPKMGYMALLRNLRNFIEKDISKSSIEYVAGIISDKNQVLNSKQLIWAFYNAHAALKELPTSKAKTMLEKAICMAMHHSIYNMPELAGNTLILVDVSGSMDAPVTINKKANKVGLPRAVVGAIMGGLISTKSQGETWVFGTDCKQIHISPNTNIMTTINSITNNGVGHGTEILGALNKATSSGTKKFNRCILLTDMQSSDYCYTFVKKYLENNPDFSMYCIDLAGYEVSCLPKDNSCYQLAGFSENVFNWISEQEAASDAIISKLIEMGKQVLVGKYTNRVGFEELI